MTFGARPTRGDDEASVLGRRVAQVRRASPSVQVRRASPSVRPKRESEIQRAILDYLELVPGVTVWRQNTGAMFGVYKGKRWAVRFGQPGLPDILGWVTCPVIERGGVCQLARFLAIEVKAPGKRLSDAQAAFMGSVRAAGGVAIVARGVEDVQSVLPARLTLGRDPR